MSPPRLPYFTFTAFATMAVGTALLLAAPAARAASEEIQVYLDDLSAPGQTGVDVHNNYVFKGARTPGYAGEVPPHHVYRLTPEFYLGLTPTLELGLYLLTARSEQAGTTYDGTKMRLKYIAPHDEAGGFFWGLNLEVGKTSLRVAEVPWNAQLKGIVGWRGSGWTLGANPNVDWSLSRGGGPAGASLDLKLTRRVAERSEVGVELYNDLGPARAIQAWKRNAKTLYLTLDQELAKDVDLNLGIGRGLTDDADRWTLKFIVGTHF